MRLFISWISNAACDRALVVTTDRVLRLADGLCSCARAIVCALCVRAICVPDSYAEINEVSEEQGAPYTLHDITSSGLTMTWPTTASNKHRVAGPVAQQNWGAITVDFDSGRVELSLHDGKSGASVTGISLQLSDLRDPSW